MIAGDTPSWTITTVLHTKEGTGLGIDVESTAVRVETEESHHKEKNHPFARVVQIV